MSHDHRTSTDPSELLDRIGRHGVARSEIELRELHRLAMNTGAASAIAGLLVDVNTAPVMRERAAARTVAAILATPASYDRATRPSFWAA